MAPGLTRSCIFRTSRLAFRSHLPHPGARRSTPEFLVLDLHLRPRILDRDQPHSGQIGVAAIVAVGDASISLVGDRRDPGGRALLGPPLAPATFLLATLTAFSCSPSAPDSSGLTITFFFSRSFDPGGIAVTSGYPFFHSASFGQTRDCFSSDFRFRRAFSLWDQRAFLFELDPAAASRKFTQPIPSPKLSRLQNCSRIDHRNIYGCRLWLRTGNLFPLRPPLRHQLHLHV